jgi:hypothetical protein
MDPEQQAQINQLRGMYGGQAPPGFRPTQGMAFQGFQVPQHAPLAGPSLGGGGQGGGGGGGGGGGAGGMMEGAQKLMGQLAQNRGTRAGQPGGQPAGGMPSPVAGGGPAGPQIVGTQAEMGPFQNQQAGGVGAGGVPAVNAGPQAQTSPEPPMPQPRPVQPYNGVPPAMTGPNSDRALPPAPMAQMTPQMQAQMPQLMKAGGELPDWLFRMPNMLGARGL